MAQSEVELPRWRLTLWPQAWRRAPRERLFALAHYHPLQRSRTRTVIGMGLMMLFCFIWGFFFAALAPNIVTPLLAPLVVLAFLVVWALPDLNWAPTRSLEWLFFAVLIALFGWPDYLAIALPGLPWITLLRLTSFPTVLVLLACISVSANFRGELMRSLHSIPAIPILLGIFVAIQLVSIGFSSDISNSIQKFIVAQTTWTAMFFAGAYVFLQPGRIKRWAMVMWALAIFVSLIALWESRIGHVPWVGHIPSFLKINDVAVERALAGSERAGVGRYRAQAIFGTPLGLAEYLALTLPFVLHFVTRRFSPRIRLAAAISIPILLVAVILTDAKLGSIGCVLGILLYIFAAAYRSWQRNKQSLIAAFFLYLYPVGLALFVAAIFFSLRLKVMILGGSSHAASTDARIVQYTIGFQKFLERPFGYGIGQGAVTLGFGKDIGGMITIDTYYLSILLEYGIAGFIVFYGMFAVAIYEAGRRSLFARSETEDKSFLLPIAVSLFVFIVIKSVFSQQDNHPVIFMMLGALMALNASRRQLSAPAKSVAGTKSIRPRQSRPKHSMGIAGR